MGERRRVRSWLQTIAAAGAEALVIELTREYRATPREVVRNAGLVALGRAVPETLAWRPRDVRARLDSVQPDAIVCVSTRAFHPAVARAAPVTVLDYVDALSRSYGDRAALAESASVRYAFRILSVAHRRFEGGERAGVRPVAAGYADAARLGATWIPNVIESDEQRPGIRPDTDVLFVGTLRFPPNIAALRRLAKLWPNLLDRRPGTTALVAGSGPVPEVKDLCEKRGWTLLADFTDPVGVYARGRVAVAPLDHTAGIQNKVIDAAALEIAQVVSPAAVQGFPPEFPVSVAATDAEFVDELVGLLQDEDRRSREASAAAAHVRERYTAAAWAPAVAELLDIGDRR